MQVKACLAFAAVIARQSFVAMALGSGAVAAHAGPCMAQIAQLQKFAQSNDPMLPQKRDSQLHHQPRLGDVNDAEKQAKTEAAAALAQAQEADARDDAACAKNVAGLKKLYGFAPDDNVTGSVKGASRLHHSFHRRHAAHAGRWRSCHHEHPRRGARGA